MWCVGWGEKPDAGGGLRRKSSGGYRMNAEDFEGARKKLMKEGGGGLEGWLGGGKRKRVEDGEGGGA